MSRTSEERARDAATRQKTIDRQISDLKAGLRGRDVPSVWGQTGKILSKGPVVPDYGRIARDPLPPAPIDFKRPQEALPSRASESVQSPRSEKRVKAPSKPWFPFVDNWLASLPKRMFWGLALVGFISGFGYGLSTTGNLAAASAYGVTAGFAGLFSLILLAQLFKLALVVLGLALGLALGLGIVLSILYVLVHALGH